MAVRLQLRAALLLVHFFFICPPEEVVDGDIVEVGDLDEGFGGDVSVTSFIMTVTALRAI